ncbi:MAG: hypothetical protein FJ102_08780 [Deltaproteobacteria bacterium]|nr:hypothetical protein [Deltaproteobacteria bacterium]
MIPLNPLLRDTAILTAVVAGVAAIVSEDRLPILVGAGVGMVNIAAWTLGASALLQRRASAWLLLLKGFLAALGVVMLTSILPAWPVVGGFLLPLGACLVRVLAFVPSLRRAAA